ncbi:MAG: hypothetical protein KI788_09795, partial [Mameliella sp.]|nr:hypothetical protein [Mameliella sp.]
WFSYWNNKEDTPFEFLHHTNPEPNPRGQGRRVPTKDNNSSSAKASYDAGHDFIKRHRSLLKEQDELLDQIKKASNETRAVLFDGSVNTAEKLIKVWPEIEAVVDRHVPKTVKKAGLPAPKLDGLNKALDLPPETKETEKA